ncbi:hypothetical protein HY030_00060 [Candidatus Gottesmanbacteria bacterium]|nr:hypothetical protein [Candidatus Gottesmanbacteria bacterium]
MVEAINKLWQRLAPTTPKENFLTLAFTPNLVKAVIWELSGKRAEILADTSEQYDETLEPGGIKAANLAISTIEEKVLGVSKVVFGVPFSWVEEGKIQSHYQSFLKKLSAELDLTPLGFVVIQDALNFYLEKEEGMPLTAILVEVLEKDLIVSLIKIGKTRIVKAKRVEQGNAETLSLILKEFSLDEVLPSNILIYGQGNNLEEVKQELISFPWLTKVDFLHFPKIEVLPKDIDIIATTYSGVSEIAGIPKVQLVIREKNKTEKAQDKLHEISKPTPEAVTEEIITKETEEETGFIIGEDILEKKASLETAENSSFELEKEFVEKEVQKSEGITPPPKEFKFNLALPKIRLNLSEFKKIKLPKLKIIVPKIPFLAHVFSWFKWPTQFKFLALFGIVVLLLFITGVAIYWNILHAEVTLIVESKTVTKSAEVGILPTASLIDDNKKIIPGKFRETTESGKLTALSTGIKTTGERARGEATIFNKTSSAKGFPEGTVLNGDGLKFSLDSSASVSAQSVNETPGGATITYGKQKVPITASAFGSKYNLAANSSFKIGDFSLTSFEGKNEQPFSGGSSREITVVSKDDQDKLLKQLTQNLLEKAKTSLQAKGNEDKKVIEATIDTTVNKKQFSSPVDSEAKDLTLDAEVKFKALVFDDQDLKSLMGKMISSEIPDGFSYQPQNAKDQVEIKEVKKDGSVVLKVNFTAKLLPKIEVGEIQKGLTGKSLSGGKKYLGLFKNVSSFEVAIKPNLPSFLLAFPRVPQNIKVDIVTK